MGGNGSAEPNRPIALTRLDVHVGDLLDYQAVAMPLTVRHPPHAAGGNGGLELSDEALGVVDVDVDLPRGEGQADLDPGLGGCGGGLRHRGMVTPSSLGLDLRAKSEERRAKSEERRAKSEERRAKSEERPTLLLLKTGRASSSLLAAGGSSTRVVAPTARWLCHLAASPIGLRTE